MKEITKITHTIEKTTQKNSQPNWTIISLVCFIIAFIFFQPFLGTICISALMAYLLFPLYRRLTKHFSDSISSIIIVVGSSLIIIIPILLISIMALSQAFSLANSLANTMATSGSNSFIISSSIVTDINDLLAPFTGNNAVINNDSIATFVKNILPPVINGIANSLLGFLGNIPQLFTSIIVYFFLLMAFLKYNKSLMQFIQSLSPFDKSIMQEYVEKSGLIVTASLKGQFVISIVTAIASTLLLCVFMGIWQYFIFFVIGLTLLGMVPLGSGIIVIPIAFVVMLTGDFWTGFWILLIYLVVICNIDSVLRPHLIPKKANLIPAITTLATFSGIYYFGILGVIYGPLIVVLLMTTAGIYASTRQQKSEKV